MTGHQGQARGRLRPAAPRRRRACDTRPMDRLHARRWAGGDQRLRPRRPVVPRGDRDRHRDAVARLDRRRARRARLDAQADRQHPRPLGPHRGQRAPSRTQTGADIAVHPADRAMLESPAPMFPPPFELVPSVPAVELAEGGEVRFGEIRLRVLHTPGHTPGSVCLLDVDDGALYSGDTLFAGAWGRTDLPGRIGRRDRGLAGAAGRPRGPRPRPARATAPRPRSAANGPGWISSAARAACRSDVSDRRPAAQPPRWYVASRTALPSTFARSSALRTAPPSGWPGRPSGSASA